MTTRLGRRVFVACVLTIIFFSYATQAKAQAVNLIPNGSLEAASGAAPTGWIASYWGSPVPTFTYPAQGNAGTKGASITLKSNSTGDANWQPSSPVSVTPGAAYTYSTWYSSNVASEIDVEYISSTGAVSYAWLATLPSSAGVWKQFSLNFTVPAGMTKATVYQLITKKGTLTIDDVSLTPVGATPPPPPPSTPTLTLSAAPTSLTSGQSSTLTWSSTNVTSCTASNAWSGTKALSGSLAVSPTVTSTFVLTCTGAGGSISQQVTVNVSATTPPPTPTLTFTASPTTVTSGQSSILSWSSSNVTSCTASSGWSGTKSVNGTQTVSPTTNTTYTLTCSGSGGSVSKSASVSVSVPPPTPGVFTEGMVTLSFDDSWLSQYTNALPILQNAGIKGTFYFTTQPVQEGWSDYMTPTHIKDIATKGHEVADHTVTHPHLPQLSQSQVLNEITASRTYLQNLTGKTVTSFAYPYGELNTTVENIVKQAGYTSARGTDDEVLASASRDKFNLTGNCVLRSTPLSTIKSWIDKAKANKQWFILCIHEVRTLNDDYSMPASELQQIVDYLKQTGIKVVTVSEGRALMGN